MKHALMLSIILLLPSGDNALAMSQITLQNNTSFWVNLFIDANYGCGPVMPNGFCTSSVTPGSHLLTARKGSDPGTSIASEIVSIEDGASPTWTVTYEDPDQALLKKLDGARYVSRFSSQWMTGEDELVVRGTTLVWRNRLTWASPEVAEAIASGTGGFRHRSIGTWEEFGRMQIIGRDARQHRILSNGKANDVLFIISEDGNSITKTEGDATSMFHRQ